MTNAIKTITLSNGNTYAVGTDSRGDQLDTRMLSSDVTRNRAYVVARSITAARELAAEAEAWGARVTRTDNVLVISGE